MVNETSFFNKQAENFHDELREEALRRLREENVEYAKLQIKAANLSGKVEAMLESMKKGNPIPKHMRYTRRMRDMENEYLYLQGYRDCMKYLRLIGAFGDYAGTEPPSDVHMANVKPYTTT